MGCSGSDGHWIHDHSALRALDLVDFPGLLLNRQVPMNDAQAALLRHSDGQT